VPRLCEFYRGLWLTTEEKARKNLCQGKKNLSQVKKNSHSTVYVLSKTPTHYKALTNTHITKPTQIHTLQNNIKPPQYKLKERQCTQTHVDRYSVNSKNVNLVGFAIETLRDL
jgi:hypothetical protein